MGYFLHILLMKTNYTWPYFTIKPLSSLLLFKWCEYLRVNIPFACYTVTVTMRLGGWYVTPDKSTQSKQCLLSQSV